ncbi:hypothetical protein OnM2_051073 [Erysiphe neolycopersici]|uniref:Uncharacterized protein n=1 Tax=Erysiphe neolycopersici TaxID=212602 RepID=A0A420HSH3_9PEZI|nr:hypothetical protein OnM2_051073 [Erysiphe neolycopersici]
MIPGLIDHFNGTATIPTNPISIRRSFKDLAINDDDIKIVYLSDPRKMYVKLRSEFSDKNDSMKLRLLSDIFDNTTQKSAPIHSKFNQLLGLNAQLGNLDRQRLKTS